jgi:8-amino-7-oxononanoate synthase
MQDSGFDVRAIRPPTVPDGTSRLRVSIHADRHEAEILGLADAFRSAMAAS